MIGEDGTKSCATKNSTTGTIFLVGHLAVDMQTTNFLHGGHVMTNDNTKKLDCDYVEEYYDLKKQSITMDCDVIPVDSASQVKGEIHKIRQQIIARRNNIFYIKNLSELRYPPNSSHQVSVFIY